MFGRGPSVASSLGLARAFDGGGGLSNSSLGLTLVGVVIAIATCVAAIGFGRSLNGFVSHPDRWGWHWDAIYDSYETGLDPGSVAILKRLPEATGVTVGTRGTIDVGHTTIAAFGLDAIRGDASPIVLEGASAGQRQ